MTRAARIGLIVLLAGYGLAIITNPGNFRLIDNVDLAIHEAGHVFFSPLGEFVGYLGGTLMQLIVPEFGRLGQSAASGSVPFRPPTARAVERLSGSTRTQPENASDPM